MAATGYTPISLYYSTTASAVPVNTNLVNGELAINITDGKLYYKDNAGVVKLLASNAATTNVSTFSAGTTGFTPSSATSGAVTLAGTLNVANGGTGLTSLTAGSLPYGAGTSAFGALAIGTSGQILTSSGTAPQWTTLSGVAVTAISFGTTGLTPSTSTSGSITVAGTLATTNGGTGLTSFTSGGAVYATSTSALTTGTLPVTAGGTGLATLTAGYIPFGAGTSAFGSSANLFWDNTNTRLGIGTVSPTTKLQVTVAPTGSQDNGMRVTDGTRIIQTNITGATYSYIGIGASETMLYSTGNPLNIASDGQPIKFIAGTAERMRIDSTGQIYVNATSGTGLVTIASSTVYPALKVPNIVETANTVAAAPSATQTFYMNLGAVQYYTSNAANNWTVNFAMSSGTSLNTAMAVGDSMSCTMLTTQGSTAYYNSAVQIDGVSVTPKWQGGTAPTTGNASSIDSYTYVIYKTASATYTVLASQTKFA